MNLGKNVYNLRKRKELSQEQLAEKVNVTRQTVSNWELGSTSPNPEQLILLSKTLNVSVDELIGNDIKQNNNLVEENLEQNNKNSLSRKSVFILFILFIAISIIWGITSIVCLTENNITTAIIDLFLCIVWSAISIMWYYKKIK